MSKIMDNLRRAKRAKRNKKIRKEWEAKHPTAESLLETILSGELNPILIQMLGGDANIPIVLCTMAELFGAFDPERALSIIDFEDIEAECGVSQKRVEGVIDWLKDEGILKLVDRVASMQYIKSTDLVGRY